MEHTLPLSSAAYHRAAFSSFKHEKLPEEVKKMKTIWYMSHLYRDTKQFGLMSVTSVKGRMRIQL